ncbi:flavodoxin family protein [Chloroflexota bacterium]
MKILGIACSPRKHGNTELLVNESLAVAKAEGAEVELISLADKTVSPCDGCSSCRKTEVCHIKDDMQDIYTKLLEADGIIFGAPVYFWGLNAQAKALIDRTYVFSPKRKLKNKIVGAILVLERDGGTGALATFNDFFTIQKMIMVGRAIGLCYDEGYFDKEAVRKDKKGMEQAKALGEIMVKYLKSHKIPY